MHAIEQKIVDFFDRFSQQYEESSANVKLVIDLVDNSTENLTPNYYVAGQKTQHYCLINEIIKLNPLEKMVTNHTGINHKIGQFFVEQAKKENVSIQRLKGMIMLKGSKIYAGLFLDGKQHSTFSVSDFIK